MEYTKKYVQKLEAYLKKQTEPREQNFVILKKAGLYQWVEYTAMVGTSPEDAIAKVFMRKKASGTYLAIPGEYWVRQVNFDVSPERIA